MPRTPAPPLQAGSLAVRMRKKPKASSMSSPPPLLSIDWIGRFVAAMIELRPDTDPRFATRLAIDLWPELKALPPEDAAATSARRDPDA